MLFILLVIIVKKYFFVKQKVLKIVKE